MGVTLNVVTNQSLPSAYNWVGASIPNTLYDAAYVADYDKRKTDWIQAGNLAKSFPDLDPVRYYAFKPTNLDVTSDPRLQTFYSDVSVASNFVWNNTVSTVPIDTARIDAATNIAKSLFFGGTEPNITMTIVYVNTNTNDWSGKTFIGTGAYSNQVVVFMNATLNPAAGGFSTTDLSPGSWGFATLLHEVGHGLGLFHSSEPAPLITDFSQSAWVQLRSATTGRLKNTSFGVNQPRHFLGLLLSKFIA